MLDLIYEEELDALGVDEWHESKVVKLTKRRNVDIERLRKEDCDWNSENNFWHISINIFSEIWIFGGEEIVKRELGFS